MKELTYRLILKDSHGRAVSSSDIDILKKVDAPALKKLRGQYDELLAGEEKYAEKSAENKKEVKKRVINGIKKRAKEKEAANKPKDGEK